MAKGMHSQSRWGRRAEDPFRGLRAGPVRYSPLFYFCWWLTANYLHNLADRLQNFPSLAIAFVHDARDSSAWSEAQTRKKGKTAGRARRLTPGCIS